MIVRKEAVKSKQAGSARPLRAYVLTFSCMALLASGFFFAAHQHFSSMDYGMKNSRLRRQIDQLEAEKRRLVLAREISLSPSEIKKAVKKVGMTESFPFDGQLIAAASPAKAKAAPAPVVTEKSLVTKTVDVKAVATRVNAVLKKKDGSSVEAKRAILSE